MRKDEVVIGTVAGLAIGALAGVLFAPGKDSLTRQQIFDSGNDYLDEQESKVNKFRNSITEKFESSKKDAERLANKGKAKNREVQKDAMIATTAAKA
jgi:gas vesicle protein